MTDATLAAASRAEGRRPRLGFVGVGWIGRHRMEAVAKSGAADVAAVLDPSPEAVAAARATAPDAEAAPDFGHLLDMDLDGVVIATPNALHADQAVAALDRGMHVFCQKPLARTALEARRVVDAARRADRLLGLDLSYRHTEAMRRMRDVVSSGGIGDVYAVEAAFHNAYGPDKGWFYDPTLSGGGCVLDLGIHMVDLALWVLGFPRVERVESRLYARGRRLAPPVTEVEDYAVARFDLATGAVADVACSWKLHAGRDCVIRVAFHGTEGGVEMRNVNGSFFDFVAERYRGTARERLSDPPDEWGGRAIVDWASRVAAGERFSEEAERFVDVARALDGVYGR